MTRQSRILIYKKRPKQLGVTSTCQYMQWTAKTIMRINSIPERNCLTLENLTAWETKNYQQKKYNYKQKYVRIYFLV